MQTVPLNRHFPIYGAASMSPASSQANSHFINVTAYSKSVRACQLGEDFGLRSGFSQLTGLGRQRLTSSKSWDMRLRGIYASAHTKASNEHTAAGVDVPAMDLSKDFHRYAVEWQKEQIRWYLDGVEIGRTSTPPDMDKPMYLLANLAVGGDWAGEPDSSTHFPGILAIDWIRAYRRTH